MKTKIFFTLLSLISVGQVLCAQPLTVAVYDFQGEANAINIGAKITTLVTADLTTETNLVLLERAALDKALNEQAFGVSGLVNVDAAAKIGELTGAKVLVAGQVITVGDNHLVVIANVIGTETGRLFADKVEGKPDDLVDLTSALSRKIAQTIEDQTTNLVAKVEESHAARLDRIVKSIAGTNRPSVSVNIEFAGKKPRSCPTVNTEFGVILLKAGFPIVDESSDHKPDIEITGVLDHSVGPHRDRLYSYRSVINLKVQNRLTGQIIAFDHQESTATDLGRVTTDMLSQTIATDELAERILPLLAKQK